MEQHRQVLALDTGFVRGRGSAQHGGVETRRKIERERKSEKRGGGERRRTARTTGDADNPGKKKGKRRER